MNKKIKSISETLLFSFLFSLSNPTYSLAMENKEDKKVFDSIRVGNIIAKEDINNRFLGELVDSCIKQYRKDGHYIQSLNNPYQYDCINGILECSNKFKENLIKISSNIYNILCLYPFYSHGIESNYQSIICSSVINLIDMYAHFIAIYSTFALNWYRGYSNRPIEFVYDFYDNTLLRDLMKCLSDEKNGLTTIELYDNFENNKKDFLKYCKNISESMSEIVSTINETCVACQPSYSEMFYCTIINQGRFKFNPETHDIIIVSNPN